MIDKAPVINTGHKKPAIHRKIVDPLKTPMRPQAIPILLRFGFSKGTADDGSVPQKTSCPVPTMTLSNPRAAARVLWISTSIFSNGRITRKIPAPSTTLMKALRTILDLRVRRAVVIFGVAGSYALRC